MGINAIYYEVYLLEPMIGVGSIKGYPMIVNREQKPEKATKAMRTTPQDESCRIPCSSLRVARISYSSLTVIPERALSNFDAGFGQTDSEALCRFHELSIDNFSHALLLLKMQGKYSHRDGEVGLR